MRFSTITTGLVALAALAFIAPTPANAETVGDSVFAVCTDTNGELDINEDGSFSCCWKDARGPNGKLWSDCMICDKNGSCKRRIKPTPMTLGTPKLTPSTSTTPNPGTNRFKGAAQMRTNGAQLR